MELTNISTKEQQKLIINLIDEYLIDSIGNPINTNKTEYIKDYIDSLDKLELLLIIEKHFDIMVNINDFENCETFGQAIDLILFTINHT